MIKTQESSIIVCGIVRNASKGLRTNIPIVTEFCKNFKKWNVVVYENDSTDDTLSQLKLWKNNYPDCVHIISEQLGKSSTIPSKADVTVNPFFSAYRIRKMVSCRNKYMDYVMSHNMKADFLMVVDLDVAKLFYDGLLDSFMRDEPWDAVTAYGYSLSPKLRRRYHDTYAYCKMEGEKMPQTEHDISFASSSLAKQCAQDDHLIPVYSAFGGCAIYRFKSIENLRYQLLPNLDNRVEVRCEHFSLCDQMHKNGFGKIYINPRMKLKYQDVTISLILKRLLNR